MVVMWMAKDEQKRQLTDGWMGGLLSKGLVKKTATIMNPTMQQQQQQQNDAGLSLVCTCGA
jgi:hypothetical protein